MTLHSRVVSTLLIAFVLACGHALGASEARAWDWFRAENGNVREGNERLRASDAAGALRSYELAARELPSDPGVHLNRGLALLALDQHDKAREAFLLATEPPASAPIRAAAYYDLGLAFYRQADTAATAAGADAVAQGGAIPGALPGATPGPAGGAVAGVGAPAPQADHREAQRLFREAADGFRRSLRIVPGNRDAAWNLELALRRLREEEEQQRQEDEQRRAEQEQQQQQQQDQQAQNDPNQPPQDGQDGEPQQDQPPQDQPPQDGQDGDQPQQPGDQQQQDQPPQNQPPQDQQAQNDATQPQPQLGEENGDEGGERDQGQDSPQGDGLPGDVARVLDALRDGEDNLERYRARARALRENRAPAQDW